MRLVLHLLDPHTLSCLSNARLLLGGAQPSSRPQVVVSRSPDFSSVPGGFSFNLLPLQALAAGS